jgi:glycosyltransferase involved in cell wall biosynthesis
VTRHPVALVTHSHIPGDPRLLRQSTALVESGREVDIFCLRRVGEERETRIEGARILRMPVRRTPSGFAGHLVEYLAFTHAVAWSLAREHRRRGYAVVQVANVPDFLVLSAVPERLRGIPVLLDLHEDLPAFFADRFRHPLLRSLRPIVSAVARGSAALADELITVHEPLRQLALERGVRPDRISVVMNGADGRLFDPQRWGRRPFMVDGVLRLIHHSNLQRLYGLDRAIAGLAGLPADLDWRLDVYGEGPWRPVIERTIAETGTAARIRLHGWADIEALPALIADADIGLVPSLAEPYLAYSLSTKLLEYAAMGVPIVASDLETNRAHFTDAAIRYVPGGDPAALADAVREMVADPDATVARGVEALRQAEPFAWEHQRQHYLDVVDRLAGS